MSMHILNHVMSFITSNVFWKCFYIKYTLFFQNINLVKSMICENLNRLTVVFNRLNWVSLFYFCNCFTYKIMPCLLKIEDDYIVIFTLRLRELLCEKRVFLVFTNFSYKERSRSLFLKLSFGEYCAALFFDSSKIIFSALVSSMCIEL